MLGRTTKVIIDTRKVPREKQPQDYSDQELVALTLNGNEAAYQVLIDRYRYQLMVYILRIVNFHQEDAEEISSETWIKIYKNLDKYNPAQSFSSWIYRIAHNACIDQIRRTKRLATRDVTTVSESKIAKTFDFDKPTVTEINEVLSHLRNQDKKLMELYYIQELTITEMSDLLSIPKNLVSARLSRARSRAREIATKLRGTGTV